MASKCLEPLMVDGWLEFNRWKWGVKPLWVEYTAGKGPPAIRAVLYLNRRGRIVLPRLNPYLPLVFEPTPTEKRYRLCSQWLEMSRLMAQDMRRRGLRGTVQLSPRVTDARSWRWEGFRLDIVYTFYLDFPLDLECAHRQLGRSIRRALEGGYRAERTTDMAHVLATLQDTEARQGFRHGLSLEDLKQARKLVGDESLRGYVAYAPNGTPVSSHVALHVPGQRAIDWIGGTTTQHLRSGATQLVLYHAYQDLQAAGATGTDMVGANIPSVASAKMQWGGYLVSHPTVEAYCLRSLAGWALGWLRFRRVGGRP